MKSFKTFLGTAATMTLGLGKVPNYVKIYNLATGLAPLTWNEGMLANSVVAGGILDLAGTYTPQTFLQGLQRYTGGDVVANLSNNVIVDPAILSANKVNLQGGATLFTMDNTTNFTGHWNGVLASGAGAGSFVELAYKDAQGNFASWVGRVAAQTGNGGTANYVTLEPIAPTISAATVFNPAGGARVVYIGPAYDLIAAPVGTVMPGGVKLLNANYMTPAVQMLIEWE